MTTRFECPTHGAIAPGQILHNGHTYTCSTCGQGLRANNEDTRDAEIVRLRAENAALAAHVERLRYALTEIASLTPVSEDTLAQRQSWTRVRAVLAETPETSLARFADRMRVEGWHEAAAAIRYRYEGPIHADYIADFVDENAPGLSTQAEATS